MSAVLSSWQNFYVMIGTAAATLAGLIFLSMSFVAGVERRVQTLDAGIEAFNTPTVVHFGAVLLVSAIMNAPWQSIFSLQLALGLVGSALVIYLLIVMRRMRSIPHYQTPFKDWLWYMAFPLAAYILLIAAAMALPANPALYVIGAGMLALLFLAIRNAWDLVTYLALPRSETNHAGKQ